jgi:hypothetical protein
MMNENQMHPEAADLTGFGLTQHARKRMCARRITLDGIRAALDYGRVFYTRGATIYVLGRKELEQCRRNHLDISRWNGLQVVCSGGGTILTAYRNESFRGLRPRGSLRQQAHLGGSRATRPPVFHDTFPQPISR